MKLVNILYVILNIVNSVIKIHKLYYIKKNKIIKIKYKMI